MAGLKTGSLFACPAEDRRELNRNIRELNGVMVPRGVRLLPVRCRGGRALIYMYRPERLRNDLKDRTARDILRQKRVRAVQLRLILQAFGQSGHLRTLWRCVQAA